MGEDHRLDEGYAWVIAFQAFLATSIGGGSLCSFGVFLPIYVSQYKETNSTVTWIGSLGLACLYLTQAAGGYLADKFGNRLVVFVGMIVVCFGYYMASLSNQVWQLYLTQGVLAGAGSGLATAASVGAVGQWFKEKRGFALAFAKAGTGVGVVYMPIVTSLLIDNFGTSVTLQYYALFNLCILMLCVIMIRSRVSEVSVVIPEKIDSDESKNLCRDDVTTDVVKVVIYNSESRSDMISDKSNSLTIPGIADSRNEIVTAANISTHTNPPSTKNTEDGFFQITISLFKDSRFLIIYFATMTTLLANSMITIFFPSYGIENGLASTTANLLLSLYGVGTIVGRLFWGYIYDYLGTRKAGTIPPVVLACGVVTFGAIGCHTLGPLVIFSLIFGFFIGGRSSLVPALIAELFASDAQTARVGQVLGVLVSSYVVGELFGPPIMGALVDINSTYVYGLTLSGLVFVAASMLYDYGSELTATEASLNEGKDNTRIASKESETVQDRTDADNVGSTHRSWIVWTCDAIYRLIKRCSRSKDQGVAVNQTR